MAALPGSLRRWAGGGSGFGAGGNGWTDDCAGLAADDAGAEPVSGGGRAGAVGGPYRGRNFRRAHASDTGGLEIAAAFTAAPVEPDSGVRGPKPWQLLPRRIGLPRGILSWALRERRLEKARARELALKNGAAGKSIIRPIRPI